MLRPYRAGPAALVVVALCALFGGESLAEPVAWQPASTVFPGRLTAAAPTRDGWVAVGGGGLLALERGLEVGTAAPWVVERTATTAELVAVWAAPEGDVFAVGSDGTLLHRAPSGLVATEQLEDHVTLHAVSGRSARDVWAVGDAGVAVHFDGARWVRVPTGLEEALWSVDASAAGVFAGGTGVVLELGRGAVRRLPPLGEGRMVRALRARSARDLVALADGLVSFDGRVWTQRVGLEVDSTPLCVRDGRRVLVLSSRAVAVVEGPTVGSLPTAELPLAGLRVDAGVVRGLARDGSTVVLEAAGPTLPLRLLGSAARVAGWSMPLRSFAPQTAPSALGLESEGWTAEVAQGGVVHLRARSPQGAAAAPTPSEADEGLPFEPIATFPRGDERLAIGRVPQGVAVFRHRAGRWETLADAWAVGRWPGVPNALGGTPRAGEPFWLAGPGFFVQARRDGRFERRRLGARQAATMVRTIAEVAGALYAWGDGGAQRFDGRTWRLEPGLEGGVSDLAARGDRVLALGGAGLSVRRASATFAPIDADGTLAAGLSGIEQGSVRACQAASARDVWLATESRLARFDGQAWRPERTFVDEPVDAIAGRGDALWLVTRAGAVLTRTARGIRPLAADPRTRVTALRVEGPSEAFLGGPGTILRWDGRRLVRERGEPPRRADAPPPPWTEPPPSVTAFARMDGKLYAFLGDAARPLLRQGGRWEPAPADDPAAALPTDPRRPDLPIPICASLEPDGGPAMLVSCAWRLVLTRGPDGWQVEPLPGQGELRGATCVPGEGCWLFDEGLSWRWRGRAPG